MKSLTALLGLWLLPLLALAQTQLQGQEVYQDFGEYRVFYSVFNTSFLQPDIAALHNIDRAKDQALVNIAVTRKTASGYTQGLPAAVSGVSRNLMQQQKTLNFTEVREQAVAYYLAPVRFTDEEILHFTISVETEPGQPPLTLNFTKKLYVDR